MQKWRNWQTRRLQVPVAAMSCGFKSHLLHQSLAVTGLSRCGFVIYNRTFVPAVKTFIWYQQHMKVCNALRETKSNFGAKCRLEARYVLSQAICRQSRIKVTTNKVSALSQSSALNLVIQLVATEFFTLGVYFHIVNLLNIKHTCDIIKYKKYGNKSILEVIIMNYVIREIKESEHELLNEFLYEAIFIPEGTAPPPKSIIENRDLQVYVKDFGLFPDDKCYVAEVDNKVIGAVWVRIMNDYGHVDDETPSFAISIYKEYRNFGIGTELMKTMLDFLKERGYKQASLAVQKANYAVKMYLNVGFEIINENDEEFIMTCSLNSDLSV